MGAAAAGDRPETRDGEAPAIRPYDYGRRAGVHWVNWAQVEELCRRLAEGLAEREIEAVVGIARGGLVAATLVALSLRLDLYPVVLTRRVRDQVRESRPVWRTPAPESLRVLAGRRVAVVDDMADTGETLEEAARALETIGASAVVRAALAAHSWTEPRPDVVPLVTDALVVWPWGRHVLEPSSEWRLHPEYLEALRMQAGA